MAASKWKPWRASVLLLPSTFFLFSCQEWKHVLRCSLAQPWGSKWLPELELLCWPSLEQSVTEINLCWLKSRGSEENKRHWFPIFQNVNISYIWSKNSFTFVQKCYTSMHGLQIHFQINFSSSQLDFWNPGSKYTWIRCYSCTPDSRHLFSFASSRLFYYQYPVGSQHLLHERIVCYNHTSLINENAIPRACKLTGNSPTR